MKTVTANSGGSLSGESHDHVHDNMNMLADEERTATGRSFLSPKQIIAAVVFAILAAYLAYIVPTVEIAWVSAILVLTIYLFAFEVVGVDVAAATVMVILGLTSLFAPIMGLEKGLVDNTHLFDGFASNAVISIIAVMIIGAGLDRTGIMSRVAAFILKIGGTTEARIIPIISATVGFISSFMQNVGAAALFLPVVSRISARSGLPMSRLLMPMGFTAILGGTMTMVGSSPLMKPDILLPMAVARNQPPIIRPTSRLGDSLVTRDRPIGERHSSPMVITR